MRNGGRQADAFFGNADVGGADPGHEQSWQQRDVEALAMAHQVNRYHPQREDRQGLVGP